MGKHKFLYIFFQTAGFKRTRSVIIGFCNQSRLKYSLKAQDVLSSLLYLASHRLLIFASFTLFFFNFAVTEAVDQQMKVVIGHYDCTIKMVNVRVS